ncbi:tetraacyldisaccharide 4'-kinase [Nitrosococcus halophilus Nc 4]|uniref:Tetraacyldisaccharide 4'-kinase n=1 Tax=Nitrosococcus halophilus (strain Nc4) TaxID=472759 RepID=D5BW60_NITHN|nr:tetraacyldisaccharide 4'-kinase [Nitrosococcus halophilus]ADE13710.1 tetraacyldisaccharide 4'-kinase [Nitrosococcus halophilus Nc 4]
MLDYRSLILNYWYSTHPTRWLLTPLSALFQMAVKGRQWAYSQGLRAIQMLPVPVLVIGNLTLGGTGKTPLIIWLAQFLRRHGYRPGLISRGYGGQARNYPQRVYPDSDPRLVGDEAILLARRTACPLVVGPDRAAAARTLLAHAGCDVLLSDDGLQHYALGRDIEILVVDGARRFGNGHCLPAGPLREPLDRLQTVDLVVTNGFPQAGEFAMHLQLQAARRLTDGTPCPLKNFRHSKVHGVAGIGNPERFFIQLQTQGLTVQPHPFPDHHRFQPDDLTFEDQQPVLMTEKDAVKCTYFARDNHWSVPLDVSLPTSFGDQVLDLLQQASRKKLNIETTG